jgi:pilus assembly protein CpaE
MTLAPLKKPSATVLPPLRIDAFVSDKDTAAVLNSFSQGAAAARQKWTVINGEIAEALDRYRTHPSPDLVIFQTDHDREKLLIEIETLARACDAKTRAIVVGRENDVGLFRTLQQAGVSDYLAQPLDHAMLADAISGAFRGWSTVREGKVIAFLGATGGCGSSTVAQNVAVALTDHIQTSVVLADLDLQGGTVKLNFDDRGVAGLTEVLRQIERVDSTLLERLTVEHAPRLRLLTCEPDLQQPIDLPGAVVDHLIGLAIHSTHHVCLDLPRVWSRQTEDILKQADEIVVTVTPDLVGLRNFRLIVDKIASKASEQHNLFVVVNQAKMPGRTEVSIDEFRQVVGANRVIVQPFDARAFSRASAKGRPLVEASKTGIHQRNFHALARQLASASGTAPPEPMLSRLRRDIKRWW